MSVSVVSSSAGTRHERSTRMISLNGVVAASNTSVARQSVLRTTACQNTVHPCGCHSDKAATPKTNGSNKSRRRRRETPDKRLRTTVTSSRSSSPPANNIHPMLSQLRGTLTTQKHQRQSGDKLVSTQPAGGYRTASGLVAFEEPGVHRRLSGTLRR